MVIFKSFFFEFFLIINGASLSSQNGPVNPFLLKSNSIYSVTLYLKISFPLVDPSLSDFDPSIVSEKHFPVSISPFSGPRENLCYRLLIRNQVRHSDLIRVVHAARRWVQQLGPIFDAEFHDRYVKRNEVNKSKRQTHELLHDDFHVTSPVDHAARIDVFAREFFNPTVSILLRKLVPNLPYKKLRSRVQLLKTIKQRKTRNNCIFEKWRKWIIDKNVKDAIRTAIFTKIKGTINCKLIGNWF